MLKLLLRGVNMYNLFENITENEKNELLKQLNSFTYKFNKNEIIPKDIFFKKSIGLILEGEVNIIKINYNETETIVDIITQNDILSTLTHNILEDDYELTTNNVTTILIIDFTKIIQNNIETTTYNQFLKNILNFFSNKLLESNNHIEVLRNKTIRNKLLTYFRQLSKKNGSNIIYLPFNYTSLANYLGVDRSSMNRELKNLKDENLIETKGTRIKLNYYIN